MDRRLTLPNILTSLRVALALLAGWLVLESRALPAAVVLLTAAAVLDAVDGWVARALAHYSRLGTHIDPLADKVLIMVVFAWVGADADSPWVWSLVGAAMAREAGVAAWAATASAIFLQALAVGTGAAMAAIAGGPALEAYRPGVLPWFWMAGALAVAGVVALLHPRVSRSVLALAGMGAEVPTPGAGPIVVGLLSNLVAWVGYGLAFWLLAAVRRRRLTRVTPLC